MAPDAPSLRPPPRLARLPFFYGWVVVAAAFSLMFVGFGVNCLITGAPVSDRWLAAKFIVFGLILLDGSDLPLMHLIQECPVADVHIGMRVEAVWVDEADLGPTLESIRYFRPNGEPSRALVDLELTQSEQATPGQNPTTRAIAGLKVHTLTDGDSLWGSPQSSLRW